MSVLSRAMTESDLLDAITEAATFCGWRWFHLANDQRTVFRGHVGWPDLFMVKGSRVLALELKRQGNKPTGSQTAWLDALNQTSIQAHVIYPDDLDTVLEWLRQ
jgi:hypothetical protein